MKRYTNRQARNYQIKAKLTAGVVLSGAETKAVKTRGIQLEGAIVQVKNGEFFLANAVIAPYPFATGRDYNPRQTRKLLLKKKEIVWLAARRREKLTIIPLACYTTKRGWIKIQLGLGRIKKKREKKQELIKREERRRIKRYF